MKDHFIFNQVIGTDKQKPFLIMVHGFTQNHKVFDRQVVAFRDRFRIVLLDLRGHGDSSHLQGPYGIEEYTDDLEVVFRQHSLKKFYYWGTHTGTAIGLVYALRHPGDILGMVLEGTVLPGFPMPRVTELIERAKKIAAEKGVPAAKKDWFNQADWFAYIQKHKKTCRAEEHWEIIRAFQGDPWVTQADPREVTDVSKYLRDLPMPMLMFNGAEDLDDFLKVAEYIKHQKPEVQHTLIPNAGGFPGWENPEQVNKSVHAFFDRIFK